MLPCHDARGRAAAFTAARRERIQPLVQDGYIMVTWANEHYLDFARTWVASMRRVGITGYIVGAMDDDMLR
jgi:arabinosyltransferase